MNNKYWLIVLVVVALSLVFVSVSGCNKGEEDSSVGVISDVAMSTAVDSSDRPINPTTVFPVDTQAFYCSFRASHFPPDSKILVQWVYVTGEVVDEVGENNIVQMNTGTLGGDGYASIAMQVSPDATDSTWPRGEYKVILSVNGEEKASVSFNVE
jgi:hypothetical protein